MGPARSFPLQPQTKQHQLGLLMVAGAALAWSSAGFWVRLISADLMTMLFWRGLFSGLAVMLIFIAIERGNALAILKGFRWPAFAAMLFSSFGMITGIGSLRFTTVAEAMTIYATLPFLTAGVAWVFIGERPRAQTLFFSAIALVGVAFMMKDAEWGGSLFGKLLALGMTLSMAGMTTVMRRHPEVPMLPSMAGSAWLTSFVCFWFAAPMSVSMTMLGYIAVFGMLQNAIGLVLYASGSRHVPAAEATFLAALEVPLTPFWVWLIFSETPSRATLTGGAIVLAAMFGHIVMEWRRR
jgi:drug/metabolite transporter (DMT)-like permease